MISLRIVSLKEKKENENSKSESFFDLDDVVQKVLLFVVCSRLLFAARRNITFDREHSLRMPWIEVRVSRIFTGNQDSPKPGFLPTSYRRYLSISVDNESPRIFDKQKSGSHLRVSLKVVIA